MPTRFRGLFYGAAFLLAAGTAVWMRYGAESAWRAGIVVGVLVFALIVFMGPRLMARYLGKRMVRAMSEINCQR